MQGFGKSATFELNLLQYTNFNNEQFEYMYRKYTISEIAYFIALKRVSVISQITNN